MFNNLLLNEIEKKTNPEIGFFSEIQYSKQLIFLNISGTFLILWVESYKILVYYYTQRGK